MTPNVFMAQTHFVLPLDEVSRKKKRELNDQGTPLPISFVSQRNEMVCRFVELKSQPFYFKSQPDGHNDCYRRIELCAYLVSYRMYAHEEDEYFLVFGTSIDKIFDESYKERRPGCPNQSFSERICTRYDLVYLQKALRSRFGEGLSYPLHDADTEYRAWINGCVEEVAGRPLKSYALKNCIPEYAAIDVRSAYVHLSRCSDRPKLDRRFDFVFFSKRERDFTRHWENDSATLFALCLLKGNENMHNVSAHQVEKYRSHAFTNNRHEMMYAGRNGIAFLRTHHPFLVNDSSIPDTRHESIPDGLTNVQNIYELCMVLSMKRRMERLSRRLKEQPDTNIRYVLGKMAGLLNARLTNVVDFENRYRFIYEQMHVTRDFENLKQAGEMLSDAYQLRLSQRINQTVLLFTASALVVAMLQVVQNHINSNNNTMNIYHHLIPFLTSSPQCPSSCGAGCHSAPPAGDSYVLLMLYMLAAIIVLILFSRYVFYPMLKDLHRRLHHSMDDKL